jgi:hypothetical protein
MKRRWIVMLLMTATFSSGGQDLPGVLIQRQASEPSRLKPEPTARARRPTPEATDHPPGLLRWHKGARTVDADFNGWSLQYVLQRIATASGWRVFVEPGLETQVGARFDKRPEREALSMILADVNFALLPGTDGAPRLLVFRSNSSRATVAVTPHASKAEDSHRLDHELVVRLKRGSKIDLDQLAARFGGRVAGFLDSLNAYRLVFEDAASAEAARKALADEPNAAIEFNYSLDRPTQIQPVSSTESVLPGLKARAMKDGSAVVVALLDTGIVPTAVEHPDFLLPGVSLTGAEPTLNADLDHGPAMFETILQGLTVTQQGEGQPVRVLPVDIYGGREETSTFELAQGIVAALERGADVINLSLSGPTPSPLIHDVIRQASAAGVLTFAAPGNQPSTAPTYPAAYPEVVAVTASERSGELASYANRGAFVDLIAPGTSIVSYGGETWIVNGTSVSSAFAAGLAAGLLADSGQPPEAILAHLREKLGFKSSGPGPQ